MLVDLKRAVMLAVLALTSTRAYAGPPFDTDDPEPVDFLHWEFYVSSAQHYEQSILNATLPHFEVNFGALPDLQLHVIAPLNIFHAPGSTAYGYGDMELGMKYRFIHESTLLPQVGTFPLAEVPTGSQSRGLGNGSAQFFLPIWLQKSWGSFTTYGGGGEWFDPADGGNHWTFLGWEGQYDFSEAVTLGGELTYHSPETSGALSGTELAVGGYINFNQHDHLLFSFGHSVSGDATTRGYLGFQLTI